MEDAAKLITALGAFLSAIAWPVTVVTLAFLFRSGIRSAFSRVPILLDRVTKMKIAGLEADLDRVADASGEAKTGAVTPMQMETAAKIAARSNDHTSDIVFQLDRLAREYDTLRRRTSPGSLRNRAMGRILAKMRTLSLSASSYVDLYQTSGSPGCRLAAVAMMQMDSSIADIPWLAERFAVDQPFIFYHAAIALENYADSVPREEARLHLQGVVDASLERVLSFSGAPDAATVEVLSDLANLLRQ